MRHLIILTILLSTLTAADPLIERAVAGDAAAIAALRALGPDGLATVAAAYDAQPRPSRPWIRLFDAVAGQYLARHSRLYWYTDLDQAKAAAASSGKPIVSLRLLGLLSEPLSCANSRFFRVVLYADPTVSAWLREHVILHWSSERPVPVVTIDFGDGREIRTTVTGNSAHYVLAADGQVIDCIPGLYAPQAFLAALQASEQVHRQMLAAPASARRALLADWHRDRAETLARQRRTLGLPESAPAIAANVVPARVAGERAISKQAVEIPLLKAVDLGRLLEGDQVTAISWTKTAASLEQPKISEASLALIHADLVMSADEPAAIHAFLRTLASDTLRNEIDLHLQIHRQLAREAADWMDFNHWLYQALFLTSSDDPWLGLDPAAVYSALPPIPGC